MIAHESVRLLSVKTSCARAGLGTKMVAMDSLIDDLSGVAYSNAGTASWDGISFHGRWIEQVGQLRGLGLDAERAALLPGLYAAPAR